jgi:hypothetical protein
MTANKKPNGSGTPADRYEQFGAGTPAGAPAPIGSGPALAEELWTERSLLKRYPWSRALVRKWRRNGGGPPFVRVLSTSGKRASIFYRPSAVREWVIAHEMTQLPKNERDSVAPMH